jgi:D-arabinose 1-dehydrogenase-like Zn-dependent alcohol dehydrogenase
MAAMTAQVPQRLRGDFQLCRNEQNSGLSYDGAYAEYMLAPVEALVSIPDGLSDIDAAPLMCAGSNTFNALRHAGALPGVPLRLIHGDSGRVCLALSSAFAPEHIGK